MADTEQGTENKEMTAAEEPAGAENVAGAEPSGEAEAPVAAEPAGAEAAVAEETPSAEAAVAEETPSAEAAAAEETPSAEAAADAEQPAADAEQPATGEQAPAAEAGPAPQHTYEDLKGKTVAQMREIAEGLGEHDALHGYTTMHKEELLVALCTAMGIEAHERHEVVGIDKTAVKSRIRELKKQRDALVEAKDRKQLKLVRARIRRLKRKIHKATV